jgi:hypothetical protein
LITEGCIAIAGAQWPAAKAQILGMIKKYGHAYVHMGPQGASISPDPHASSPAAEKVVGSKGGPAMRAPDTKGQDSSRLAGAVAQEHKVTGNASIDVNVKAPKGTTVDTKAGGMFKSVSQRRSNQMPSATEKDWAGL